MRPAVYDLGRDPSADEELLELGQGAASLPELVGTALPRRTRREEHAFQFELREPQHGARPLHSQPLQVAPEGREQSRAAEHARSRRDQVRTVAGREEAADHEVSGLQLRTASGDGETHRRQAAEVARLEFGFAGRAQDLEDPRPGLQEHRSTLRDLPVHQLPPAVELQVRNQAAAAIALEEEPLQAPAPRSAQGVLAGLGQVSAVELALALLELERELRQFLDRSPIGGHSGLEPLLFDVELHGGASAERNRPRQFPNCRPDPPPLPTQPGLKKLLRSGVDGGRPP